MFDKVIAQRYLDYRQLNSLPKQLNYIRDSHDLDSIEQLHERMIQNAKDFNKMIQEMIDCED